MTNDLTDRRKVLLEALYVSSKSWSYLRSVYYPSLARQKNKASTSFNNQLDRMITKGLITKGLLGYSITESGMDQLELVQDHPCPRCSTCIPADMRYCVGCQEDLRAAGRIV